MVAAAFAIANIVGPQNFQANDAIQYIPAKVTIFVVAALAAVAALRLRVLLGVRNKTRGQDMVEAEQHTEDILSADDTDKENASFKYTYWKLYVMQSNSFEALQCPTWARTLTQETVTRMLYRIILIAVSRPSKLYKVDANPSLLVRV